MDHDHYSGASSIPTKIPPPKPSEHMTVRTGRRLQQEIITEGMRPALQGKDFHDTEAATEKGLVSSFSQSKLSDTWSSLSS